MVVRGCGKRVENGLYICTGTSLFGMPIECFIVDPPIPWDGPKVLRSPMIVRDHNGIAHVVMTVGAMYYPSPVDFIEEAAKYGVSKRVPLKFDMRVLTPGVSRLVLVHPRAIPLFDFEAKFMCPKKFCPHARDNAHADGDKSCIGALWPLAALIPSSSKHIVVTKKAKLKTKRKKKIEEVLGERLYEDLPISEDEAMIVTPSVTYRVPLPKKPTEPKDYPYKPGIFLATVITHFEYVNKKGKIPKDVKKRVEDAGYEVRVVPE